MKMNYKKAIKDKRLEAGKLMTEKQIAQCNAAIHTASVAAGAAGGFPIPIADAIPISAAQVTMVVSLGKIFDQGISSAAAKGAIAAAAATFVGRSLIKFIPFVGWFVSAAVAAGVTEVIGWTIAVDLEKKYRIDYQCKKNAANAAEAIVEAEVYKQRMNDLHDEAEDLCKSDEPIYITKNGEDDIADLSIEASGCNEPFEGKY